MQTTAMARFADSLRIAGAIALKDILDAIRNRMVQGIALGVLMMMLTGSVLPWLAGRGDVYRAVVHDPGRSALAPALRRLDGVQLGRSLTAQGAESAVAGASTPVLGLVLPEDVDERLARGEELTVEGFAVHWASEESVRELGRFYEQALTSVAERPVQVAIRESRVYPTVGGSGFPGLSSGVVVMSLLTLGMFVAPYLLLEEQDTHTLDPLLASPATLGQIACGKSAAAIVYALLGGCVGLALFHRLVVHWEVALVALLCGACMSVAFGLALGLLVKTPQALNARLGLAMVFVLVPVLLYERLVVLLPAIEWAIKWYPSVAVLRVLQASFAGDVPAAWLWRYVGGIAAWAALALCVSVLRIVRTGGRLEG